MNSPKRRISHFGPLKPQDAQAVGNQWRHLEVHGKKSNILKDPSVSTTAADWVGLVAGLAEFLAAAARWVDSVVLLVAIEISSESI